MADRPTRTIKPRYSTLALALLALVTTPAAFAQRASLADRVAALEQQASNNQGNVDLLNQVNQLRAEVQDLRGQIEQLQQQAEQAKTSGRSQYLDLDSRLNRLEGGGGQPAPAAGDATPVTPPASSGSSEKPAVYGDAGALEQMNQQQAARATPSADERASYDAAFEVLKSGRYDESARAFQSFLQAHPNGAYAPNARYWLGESYYVTQNYQLALDQFQTVYSQWPTSDKAAGALLKIGLSQMGLKQNDAARESLQRVVQQYPGTDAARTADDRLRGLANR